MSDTQTKKTRKPSSTPRKPRAKVDMSVASSVDFAAKLQEMGGTPTWISSAGSMEDASTWLPQEKGAELVGIHAGVDLRGTNQKYYKIAVSKDGAVAFEFLKAGMGNKRLDNITPGKAVRVVYNGEAETEPNKDDGKTRKYRDFLVFQTAR